MLTQAIDVLATMIANTRAHYPEVCRSLLIAQLEPGPFDRDDLEWVEINWWGKPRVATKIARARLDDFVAGEKGRGCCHIVCSDRKGVKGNVLVDDKYDCYCGKHTHLQRVEKAALGCSAAQNLTQGTAGPQSAAADKPKRRSAIEMGHSVKRGCAYSFRAKAYTLEPDVVVLLFDKQKMQHLDGNGFNVHVDASQSQPLSGEARLWVLNRLLLSVPPKNILAGAPLPAALMSDKQLDRCTCERYNAPAVICWQLRSLAGK